jgi:hypothetical protein
VNFQLPVVEHYALNRRLIKDIALSMINYNDKRHIYYPCLTVKCIKSQQLIQFPLVAGLGIAARGSSNTYYYAEAS